MDILLIGIVCYLMGSIPFGLILTKIFLKKDIRKIGSGNIGATNALRTGNKIIGYSTLILDILKAIVPIRAGAKNRYGTIHCLLKKFIL
jgi:glycerol-3-phosphate acyltransferase PlsY